MKRLIMILALSLSALVVSAQQCDTLKLMTYNIRYGELASMESIADYISSEKVDIVALQECDWNTHRGDAPRQNGVMFLNELAYYSGMFGIYGKAINFSGGYYGIGILSRYPILRYERVLLPNDGRTEQRTMLIADVELPGGKVVTFVNTHLEVMTSQMRIDQVNFINEYLKDCLNVLFLAGDMNAEPDSHEMQLLYEKWSSLTDQEKTFPSHSPDVKLDYIYSRESDQVELVGTEVKKGVTLSDHLPVISTVILR